MKTTGLLALGVVTGALLCFAGSDAAPATTLTPFRIEPTFELKFPPALLLDAVTQGDVWVLVSVSAEGKLTDSLVTRYTHRALADEAQSALGKWRYEPARRDGQPINACAEVHFHFAATGAVVSLNPMSTVASLTAFVRDVPYITTLCRPDELDRPPAAIHTVNPPTPSAGPGGRVVIDFVIDEKGRPRLPVLVSTTDQRFVAPSAEALAQWRFAPPTRRGQPVAVPARQEFVFAAQP
ncbi:MAG: energy transducer TonB [Verrucomicrobia bacterium]|nr:energy transducer TonB [Verrucomicrobiota bacterium]